MFKMDTTRISFSKRIISAVTAFFFTLQFSSVAIAAAITDAEIQDKFKHATDLQLAAASKYLYSSIDQIDTSAFESIYTAENFYADVYSSGVDNNTYIGDYYVQLKLVRSQIYTLVGRHLLDAYSSDESGVLPAQSEIDQALALYENAKVYADTGVSFGTKLNFSVDEVDANYSPYDMVWPEIRTVNGKSVIVPIVYLSKDTYDEQLVTGSQIEFGGNVTLGSIDAEDVSIKFKRKDAFVDLATDFKTTNAQIEANGDLEILAGGSIKLLSTVLKAGDDIKLGANDVEIKNYIHRYDYSRGTGTTYGQISEINTITGDITIRSYGDIRVIGSNVGAEAGEITFAADGHIYIVGEPVTSSYQGKDIGWTVDRSDVTYLTSSLSAQDTIKLIANGQIVIDASEIVSSEGHLELLAGLGISVIDQLGQKQFSQTGSFGKKDITESGYQTFAIRSLLDAGMGVNLSTSFGDVTLKSADIRSEEGTTVNASNGKVNLLLTKENDHYSYQSVKEGLVTTTVTNRGHANESIVTNTIVGGFQVEAAQGVYVEYEGLEGEECQDFAASESDVEIDNHPYLDSCAVANIEAIAKMEGMGWMKTVLEDATNNEALYEWEKITTASKSWSESKTSLSPAMIAVITIAVAIYAGPAAGQIVGATGGTFASAAMTAGLSSLMTQGAIAGINGLVNDGKFEEAFEALDSDENWRNLAISMVTAGALAQVDASFFSDIQTDDIAAGLVDQATGQLSLTGQAVQAVTHSVVEVGTQKLLGGGGEFDDLLAQSLGRKAIAKLGETMANEIKDSWDVTNPEWYETAMLYITHAGAGCILGVASAKVSDEDASTRESCEIGAGGAVVGEFIAKSVESSSGVAEEAEQLEQFLKDQGIEDPSNLTLEQKRAFLKLDISGRVNELRELRQNGVDLAKLGAALAAFVSGADASQVNLAAMTGENAAENNALFLIPVAITLLKAIDLALTADELYGVYQDYEAADEEGKKQVLIDYFGDSIEGAILDQIIEKIIPGKTTFDAMLKILADKNIISPKIAQNIIGQDIEKKKLDDHIATTEGAEPTSSGYVNKCKGQDNGCSISTRNLDEDTAKTKVSSLQEELALENKKTPKDQARITELNNSVGTANEEMTELMMSNRDWNSQAGGKYHGENGNNGFDHVFTKTDENGIETVLIVDSKQITDGSFRLGSSNAGTQLSRDWIEQTVLPNLDQNSEAAIAVKNALAGNAVLKTGAAGLDKATGEFKVIMVNATSGS